MLVEPFLSPLTLYWNPFVELNSGMADVAESIICYRRRFEDRRMEWDSEWEFKMFQKS